jgi:N-acyl homoserine lactone hydrolase
VETGEHKIMVDTGLPDEARTTKYHHKCDKRGCLESPAALKTLGVDPLDIDICIFTHLHWNQDTRSYQAPLSFSAVLRGCLKIA